MNSFADMLRETRTRAGLTQKELASALGVTDSYISMMERGTAPAPIREKVLAMAEVLNITEPAERWNFLVLAERLLPEDNKLLAEQVAEGDPFALTADDLRRLQYTSRESTILAMSLFPFGEEGALIKELRMLLHAADMKGNRAEIINLIRSFFAWLRFRQRDPTSQNEEQL